METPSRPDSVDRHVERWRIELPDLDPLHEAIAARLMHVSRHLALARENSFAADRLPRASFKILLALRRLGPPYTANPSDLAVALGLSRGALSARLSPLEDDGLITRTVDGHDRRRVWVHLTPAGREAFANHAHSEGTKEAALMDALSRADQRRLAALLRELMHAIEDD